MAGSPPSPAPRRGPRRASRAPPPLLCLHPKASVRPARAQPPPAIADAVPPPSSPPGPIPMGNPGKVNRRRVPSVVRLRAGGSAGGRGGGRAALRKGGDPCRPARSPGWWESLGTRRCSPWRCRRWGPPRPWPAASDSPPAPRGPPAPGCRPWRSPAR